MFEALLSNRTVSVLVEALPRILTAGLTMTIPLTLLSFFFAMIIAVAVALVQYANVPVLRQIARFYIWVIRGTPLLVNEFLWSSGMAVLLQCYSVRGLDVVAACNIATTVSNLFKVVFLSMGNAVAIMVGQALGANDIERAKNCTWRLMTAAVGSNLFMSILLILFAPSIPHIYNTEPHVRQIATQLLYVIAMMMPAYSFSHCCYFTLRSGGKTIITFLFDSVFTWCVNVPTAWLLVYRTGMGIVPLYFCVQALELIKVVIGFALVKKGVWIHNIVAPVAEKEAAEK
mgnify:CR=1 FL=1